MKNSSHITRVVLVVALTFALLPAAAHGGVTGDCNGDGAITVGDVFYLVNHLFAGGSNPVDSADANSDAVVTAADIFFLLNYLFAGGPAPGSSPIPLPTDPTAVAPPVNPNIASNFFDDTAFLYTGSNPIQTGVAPGTIKPTTAAVLRGKVTTRDEVPLLAVKITIQNRPEYGQTHSRGDGMFDLAVNGGGVLTVNYEKPGYLPAQRQLEVPINDYAILPGVVMIPLDTQVTAIDLTATTAVQVAQGSVAADRDGARRATLLVSQGTTATTANGTTLGNLNIRATEYTVGSNGLRSMPGPLPPTSGYTYAVEFTADEAQGQDLRFSKPVFTYVENFLNFPVGGIVPVGYYDRAKAAWVPSQNGRVIKILSIDFNRAYLDTDGDGAPDDSATMATLGITDAEREKLATLYTPGSTLWRVPITHFTPWDCNWPYGPPSDARTAGALGVPSPRRLGAGPGESPKEDCITFGSLIQCHTQTLGEELAITGAPFRLRYSSERSPGAKTAYTLEIPLSGNTLPASLRRIELEISVAGRQFSQSFPAAANQSYRFTWDSRDVYGRTLQGAVLATVRLGYVYGAVYQEPAQFEQSFGALSGIPITGSRERSEITLWQEYRTSLGLGTLRAQVSGWSFSPHHTYDPNGRILYLGDGTRRDAHAEAEPPVINTVAGNVMEGFSGDGGPATQASLYGPRSVAVAPDGTLYIADYFNGRVRRVDPDGVITTVVGGGQNSCNFAEGGQATQASLSPVDVALGPDGSLYIANSGSNRIWRIRTNGIVERVAGLGGLYPCSLGSFSGDGGPAITAWLDGPNGVAISPDGTVYIADTGNHRIRRVGLDGIITTVAGNGSAAFSGDGGPATQAALSAPGDVVVAPDGSLYIADSGNHRVRRVGPNGIITTIAGSGTAGFSGDGGPGTEARLYFPRSVAVDAGGALYIADRTNGRIRYLGADGTITTVAGNGKTIASFIGDAGPANQAWLYDPSGVAVASNGSLYIADSGINRIRVVTPTMPGASVGEIWIAAEDSTEIHVFSNGGAHLRTLNAVTGALRYEFGYDGAGRLITITDGNGNSTVINRDPNGNPTAIIAPGGQRTTLAVDSNGYLAGVINPANERAQFSYTAEGLLITHIDPKGGVYRYTYDMLGRLVKSQDPAGGMKTLTRVETTAGHTVTVTTALNRTTTYQLERLSTGAVRRINSDSNGALTEALSNPDAIQTINYPNGETMTLTFGPDPRFGMQAPRVLQRVRRLPGGQTETTTTQRSVVLADPKNVLSLQSLTDTVTISGRTFTSTYEAATRTVTETTPEGRQTISQLDGQGRVVQQQVSANTAPILVTYDARGRVVENRQGNQFWTFTYDSRNRVVARTDAAGRQTSFVYDENDRIIRTVLPSGATYQFGYDANGNRTHVTMPSGAPHDLGYTPVDLDAAYTPPTNGSYFRTYNADRQLTRMTLPGGRVVEQSYDSLGRVSAISSPETMTSFSYLDNLSDRIGQITTTPTSGSAQSITYSYNGSLITATNSAGAAPAQISYTYDGNFHPITMHLQSGTNTVQTQVSWDRDGLVSRFGPFAFTRGGPDGALSRLSDANLTASYTYDTLGRLVTRSHQLSAQTQYTVELTYDNAGRVTARNETLGGSTHTYAYTYDADGQLTEVLRDPVAVERYGYDPNGNRTSRQLGTAAAEAATYDTQDRLTQRGNVTYQFNQDGFLTRRGSDTFQYGARGQLLTATVGGQVITYAYDGLGRRVSRTDLTGTYQYIYGDPAGHMVTAVRSPSGQLTTLYYDTAGFLSALERSGTRYYVATDQVGSPRVVSTSIGVVKIVEYDSFGNVTSDSNGSFELPIGYGGGLADAATGSVHFGFRDYDPASGRWTARDPVLFQAGQGNLYVYVGNNPISNRDPFGLFCIGATFYSGIGGGGQFCMTTEGVSLCGEIGVGVGASVGVDSGGLEETSVQLVGEASVGCGPVSIGVGASLNVFTGCLKANLNAQLGPITGSSDGTVGYSFEVKDAPEMKLGKCSAQAKLAAKGCLQEKW